jgi:hypothetical protein
MRTLAPGASANIALPTTEPGFLFEALFPSGPYRRTSFGVAVSWRGATWNPVSLRVTGLATDVSKPGQSVTFEIGNADAQIGALILTEGGRGVTMNCWKCYTPTPDDADPVQLFAGAGDEVVLTGDLKTVRIKAQTIGSFMLKSPREFMSREAGFTNLTPTGNRDRLGQ